MAVPSSFFAVAVRIAIWLADLALEVPPCVFAKSRIAGGQ